MLKNQATDDQLNKDNSQVGQAPKKNKRPTHPYLEQRLAELEEQLKRQVAEFANYRRRTQEEKKQIVEYAQAQTLLELTPVLDNFRRASTHLPEDLRDHSWVTGIQYIEKQLEQIVGQFGLQKIKTVGETFNPQLHEAISIDSSATIPQNQVMEEIEAGYTFKGQVLKPAKVKVNSGTT